MRTADQIRERKRLHMARKRAENPSKVRLYQREYHHKNRERRLHGMRAYYAKRFFWARAMRLRGAGRATPSELALIWRKQSGKCALTGRKLDRSAQLDHIVAKARGGNDSVQNLRWLCKEANLARRELSDTEFINLCRDVMRWIGERLAQVGAIQ